MKTCNYSIVEKPSFFFLSRSLVWKVAFEWCSSVSSFLLHISFHSSNSYHLFFFIYITLYIYLSIYLYKSLFHFFLTCSGVWLNFASILLQSFPISLLLSSWTSVILDLRGPCCVFCGGAFIRVAPYDLADVIWEKKLRDWRLMGIRE